MPWRRTNTQAGVSLVELMVSLVLGLFLIFGAVTIYGKSRATYRTTEAVARLQETARYALDAMEPDVRMANYWGLSNHAEYVINRASSLSGTIPTPTANNLDLVETLIDRIAQIILTEFDVPAVKIRLNKQGALRGSRDVGIVIERRRADYPTP